MKKFSKINKYIPFLNIKSLILLLLIISSLIVTYFFFFKNKYFINEELKIYKNRILYGSNNNAIPKLIISGNKYIDVKSLKLELNKDLYEKKNKSDFYIISQVLERKKLLKKFVIKKISKNLFTIKIEEKNVIGLIKIKNVNYLIDEFNNLIEAKINPSLFHLPIFIGNNSNKNANVILRLIRESGINLDIMSFSLIDDRRWNINLNNGVKILLPENDIFETFKTLKKIDTEYNILKGNFVEIDLRVHGKYFLKPKIN